MSAKQNKKKIETVPGTLGCPFCGGAGEIKSQAVSGYEYVSCSVCKAEGPLKTDRWPAVAAWNRRTETKLEASSKYRKCDECPYDSGCVYCRKDLVNRLRQGTGDGLQAFDMMNEAAGEIERLRGKVDELLWALRTAMALPLSEEAKQHLMQKVMS